MGLLFLFLLQVLTNSRDCGWGFAFAFASHLHHQVRAFWANFLRFLADDPFAHALGAALLPTLSFYFSGSATS